MVYATTVADSSLEQQQTETIREPKVEVIHSPWKKRLCLLGVISFAIGAAIFIVGEQATVVEYACEGIAPSQADLNHQRATDPSVPVCITTSIRDEVMCMQAGTTDNQLPRYCHTNLAGKQDAGFRDWYLWWSSSSGITYERTPIGTTDHVPYGTAWRMGVSIVDDDYTLYKLPAEAPTNLPNGTLSWKHRSRADDWQQEEVLISIEECDADLDADGIPSACFVEKRLRKAVVAGVIFMALPVGIALAAFLATYCFFVYDEAVNGNGKFHSMVLIYTALLTHILIVVS